MSVYEKLSKVQSEVVATKDAYNRFGKYSYRSCESILEAVKPILAKYKCSIVLEDKIAQVGERIYIQAVARFIDCENGETAETSAYAREPITRKGMDDAQVTGSSSSYARKYALAGLLLLDDNKDPDVTNKHGKDNGEDAKTTFDGSEIKVSDSDIEMVKTILSVYPKANRDSLLTLAYSKYGVNEIKELTKKQYVELRESLLANANEFKKKRLDKMVFDFGKKANVGIAEARSMIAAGIGKEIDDINVADFVIYGKKIKEMYDGLGGNE